MKPPSPPARPAAPRSAPVRPAARPRAALALLLLLLPLLGAAPAAAQIPVTDAAHIAVNTYWHYVHYLQFALQVVHQIEQIQNQVRQIDAQLRALQKLRDPNWRQISGLLLELDYLIRSGRSLGYAFADIGAQFRQTYPGWTRWQDPTVPPLQAERALDTFRAGLAAVSRQTQTLATGEQNLALIRDQMARTDGHQQALEHLATIAVFSAQEQILARQSLAVAANLDAVAQGYWVNRQAQADATLRDVVFETSLAAPQSTSAGFTFQPPLRPAPPHPPLLRVPPARRAPGHRHPRPPTAPDRRPRLPRPPRLPAPSRPPQQRGVGRPHPRPRRRSRRGRGPPPAPRNRHARQPLLHPS